MEADIIHDYSKLTGRIIEVCGTQMEFSRRMGLSERTISLKLNNKIDFRQREIEKALSILNLENIDIDVYFFKQKVQKKQLIIKKINMTE